MKKRELIVLVIDSILLYTGIGMVIQSLIRTLALICFLAVEVIEHASDWRDKLFRMWKHRTAIIGTILYAPKLNFKVEV